MKRAPRTNQSFVYTNLSIEYRKVDVSNAFNKGKWSSSKVKRDVIVDNGKNGVK